MARKPSKSTMVSPTKACKILRDGTIRRKPLTKGQKGLFGAICGRKRK